MDYVQDTDAHIAILEHSMPIQFHHRISCCCVEYTTQIPKTVDRLLGRLTGPYLILVALLSALPFATVVAIVQAIS
jgi:hypothetical protein